MNIRPKKIRITHIITGLNVGGAERALHSLLTGGLQGAFENHVVSLMDEGYFAPLLRDAGVPVTCLNMSPGPPTVRAVWRLRQAMRAGSPDIIQGWMYHGNLAASLARRLAGGKAALSWNVRTSLEAQHMNPSTHWVIWTGAQLSRGPDAIIYNAHRSKSQHVQQGYTPTNGLVIPNGFDAERWHPDPNAKTRLCAELDVPKDAVLIGFVGRGHPQKDIPNLLSAFGIAANSHPSAHLVCVGRGLDDFATDGVDLQRVRFLGQRNEVERLMPSFDILCLSSSSEGFPNVIGEAMACGVPCVTTDVGDAAAIVADTGWTVPPRNSAALAATLSQALAAPEEERRARGTAARARIEARYSLEYAVDQYRTLYERLSGAE